MFNDIITKNVQLHWKNNIKHHYINKGYLYSGDNKIFEVNIKDLLENSQVLVKCKCQRCDELIDVSFCRAIKKNIICWKCKYKNSFDFYNLYKDKIENIIGNQNVNVSWNASNKHWYEYKGYKYTKQNDIFNVLAIDLPINSDIKVKVKCEYCNNQYIVRYNKITNNIKSNKKMCCEKCKKYKIENTNVKKYGYKSALFIPENKDKIIKKILITKYNNNTGMTSKQQLHIHSLIGGKHNYPVDRLLLDIAFPAEMLYIEYDGSGHNACVGYGISRNEFERKEFKRKIFLENLGWKLIRIKCKNDKLPTDNNLINIINESKKYLLNSNHTWIEINLNKMKIICSEYVKNISYDIYYDGRKVDKVTELVDVLLMKGMIPRYKANMTPDKKGRTFMFEYKGETLLAKKRDDVYIQMRNCPKIQEYFIDKLNSGEVDLVDYEQDEFEDMSKDEFENSLFGDESLNEAEETSDGWEEI